MTAPPPKVLLVGRAPESAEVRYETQQPTLHSLSCDSPTAPCPNPRRSLQAPACVAGAHSPLEAVDTPRRARPGRLSPRRKPARVLEEAPRWLPVKEYRPVDCL